MKRRGVLASLLGLAVTPAVAARVLAEPRNGFAAFLRRVCVPIVTPTGIGQLIIEPLPLSGGYFVPDEYVAEIIHQFAVREDLLYLNPGPRGPHPTRVLVDELHEWEPGEDA